MPPRVAKPAAAPRVRKPRGQAPALVSVAEPPPPPPQQQQQQQQLLLQQQLISEPVAAAAAAAAVVTAAVGTEGAPQIILHLPHASFHDGAGDANAQPPVANVADLPLPFGDEAMGLMVMTPQQHAAGDDDAFGHPGPPAKPALGVMKGFESGWPRSTMHACWWCCHPFNGPPFGLPLRHAAGVFHCTGIFCGLECVLAYNRRERHGHDAADSANHVQLMALRILQMAGTRPMTVCGVRPAPDRSLLSLFGGPLSVEEFRAMSRRGQGALGSGPGASGAGGEADVEAEGRSLCLHMPPVQAVVPAVEEISTATAGTARRIDQRIPLDLARIRRAERHTTTTGAAARAGRGAKNTLEAAMPNLKVVALA